MIYTRCIKPSIFASFFLVSTAYADNWSISADLSNLSQQDWDLRVASLSLGYEFNLAKNLSIMPLFRYGVGLNDDNDAIGRNIEVEEYIETALRGNYYFNEQIYAYAQIGYNDITYDVGFESNHTETTGGLGAGYRFDNGFSIEGGYQRFDDIDVLSVSTRFTF